jgi:hypothetical protein
MSPRATAWPAYDRQSALPFRIAPSRSASPHNRRRP